MFFVFELISYSFDVLHRKAPTSDLPLLHHRDLMVVVAKSMAVRTICLCCGLCFALVFVFVFDSRFTAAV